MTVALNTGATIDTSTTPAPEGHDAAMIAKVEGQTTPPAETTPATTEAAPERPAWLPEKFKTAEDFAKAYAELEKKQSTGSTTEKPAATTIEKPAEGSVPQTSEAAQTAVENAGLDFDALSAEFEKEGKLSDATYDKLSKGGITRAVADQYIAGQQALATQVRNELFSVAGGEEAYTDMVTWAKTGLDAASIDAYNTAMNSRDVNAMKLAVDGLKARYTAANGTTPNLIGGQSGSSAQSQGDVFRSTAELTTAMKDPRYSNDPAYREDVRARLARSNIM